MKRHVILKRVDSQKELEETILQMELLADSGNMKPRKLTRLLQEANGLMAIFNAIVRSSRKGRFIIQPS